MSMRSPFTALYSRSFFKRVALMIFTVMTLFEAVFLAERFPMVFRAVFQHNAALSDAGKIFLCNSTQVFDLALAIAVLIAVYWTVLAMREDRELLVLFAGGAGPYQVLALVLAIAVGGQVLSLTVSGVLDPAARFAQREILFHAEFRALSTGINTGQFYRFPNRVAYAPAKAKKVQEGPEPTRSLFVFEDMGNGKFRVVTADHAGLKGPDSKGNVLIQLGGFSLYTFSPQANGGTGRVSLASISASDVSQPMMLDQLLKFEKRGTFVEEMSLFEQLQAGPGEDAKRHRQDMQLLGERVARSLLCLLAPLIALAAIALTTRFTNYFVLPLACMALMSLNVTSAWLIRAIVPVTPLGAFATPSLLAVVFAAVLITVIFRKQGKLAQPQLARP
jgi:lipopolysaccharide export LptBFGC system permease protein LptF